MFHSHFLHFSSWSLSPLVWGCPSPVLLEFPVFLVLSGYQGPDIIFNPHIGWDNFWKKHPPNWQQLSRKPLKPDWPKKKIRMIDFSLSVTVIIQYQYHYCFSSKFLTFILKYRIFWIKMPISRVSVALKQLFLLLLMHKLAHCPLTTEVNNFPKFCKLLNIFIWLYYLQKKGLVHNCTMKLS